MKPMTLAALLATLISTQMPAYTQADRPLRLSEDGHSIIRADGSPFFYLADTCWELFHRTTREEATEYLEDRAAKGYTVIQAVALAELDGLRSPNSYGHLPLVDLDPARPATVDGPGNDYWDHVDYVFAEAERLGLYIALLPSWGDKWYQRWGTGPVVFNEQNAATYGEWIGHRYAERNVIWIIGGDRNPERNEHFAILNAMADAVRKADSGRNLMTLHPQGACGSSQFYAQESWLDFNSRQNGHEPEYARYSMTLEDYRLQPAKPVIDIEPLYEDHPLRFDAANFGHSVAIDVRRPLYWDLCNGAAGHTYGHHSVWQLYLPGRDPINGPLMGWKDALQQPGAVQMQHARRLFMSRDFLNRVPSPELIVASAVPTAEPGAGRYRFAAIRGADHSWAFVYAPIGRSFKVNTGELSGDRLRAWWFNPRNGVATLAGEFAKTEQHRFISPDAGEDLDWVLVLDDASRNFPAPGSER